MSEDETVVDVTGRRRDGGRVPSSDRDRRQAEGRERPTDTPYSRSSRGHHPDTFPPNRRAAYERAAGEPPRRSLRDDIALLDALISDLLQAAARRQSDARLPEI